MLTESSLAAIRSAENRPEGWNVWLTFVISPAAAPPAAAHAPIRK